MESDLEMNSHLNSSPQRSKNRTDFVGGGGEKNKKQNKTKFERNEED